MSTDSKQSQAPKTVEVERDLLAEIVEVTKAARERYSVSDLKVIAKSAAASKMFGMNEDQAFMLMSIAQAEGIAPVKALQRYHISERGRLMLKAEAALADFLKRGGRVQWLTESDDREKCEAIFSHPRLCPEGKPVRFSKKDADLGGVGGNATWKSWTPALLRARVSTIGVRMIDPAILAGMCTEEEEADIPIDETPATDAHLAKNFDNDTGYGIGAYADPQVVVAFQEWSKETCESINTQWLDRLTDKKTGEIRKGPAEIVTTYQLEGHLHKWAKAAGLIKAPEVERSNKNKYTAILFERGREKLQEEALRYCREQWVKQLDKLKANGPQLPLETAEREPGQDDDIDDEAAKELKGRGL